MGCIIPVIDLNQEIENICNSEFGEIYTVKGDFENIINVSHSQTENLGKPLAALKNYIEIEENNIPSELIQLTKKVYEIKKKQQYVMSPQKGLI